MNQSDEINLSLAKRWWIFIKERFHLLSHLPMITLFILAHLATALVVKIPVPSFSVITPVFTIIFLFFFKMRLYDEIKDYQVDSLINPTRPLPRGLLSLFDLKKAIIVIIIIEIFLGSYLGIPALVSLLLAIFYSLLMYKEFFIGKFLRPHLTTYALSHTVVTIPMGLFIFSSFLKTSFYQLPTFCYLFVLSNWCLFNIFEFGRKTFCEKEERLVVDSYSKKFGRSGALLLVLSMSLLADFFIYQFLKRELYSLIFLTVTLFILGSLFVSFNKHPWGVIYRGFSSLYIIMFYLFYIFTIFSILSVSYSENIISILG